MLRLQGVVSTMAQGSLSAEAIETPALQIRDSRRELEPEQGAEGEDMVGSAAAIGMVAPGHDLALVVEQPVKNMCGFAGCRRNHLVWNGA